jgi:hypothetical protein
MNSHGNVQVPSEATLLEQLSKLLVCQTCGGDCKNIKREGMSNEPPQLQEKIDAKVQYRFSVQLSFCMMHYLCAVQAYDMHLTMHACIVFNTQLLAT